MNYSSIEPVLFDKLHNINSKLPTISNLTTKSALNTLLDYAQDLDENLKTLYSKLVTNNNYDHKSYDANQ